MSQSRGSRNATVQLKMQTAEKLFTTKKMNSYLHKYLLYLIVKQTLRLSLRWTGLHLHRGLSSSTLLSSLSASFVFSIYRDTRASSWAESSMPTPSRKYSLTVRRGKPTATPTSQTLNLISSPTVKPSRVMTCCRPPDGNKINKNNISSARLDLRWIPETKICFSGLSKFTSHKYSYSLSHIFQQHEYNVEMWITWQR